MNYQEGEESVEQKKRDIVIMITTIQMTIDQLNQTKEGLEKALKLIEGESKPSLIINPHA